MTSNPEELKNIILNSKKPLLFRNVLKFEILRWTLEDWKSILKDQQLQFRCGVFSQTNEPQWERKTELKKESFDYFMEQAQSESNWLYFDYKYLENWFTDISSLRDSISWAPLGFPEITADDCTIWIGSKGAHTPCHVDTYGFNLIFQVFGKKLWIVCPPEENLKPTRVPYEESSVYSKLNFFSPSKDEFKGTNNFRKIILNPGEVLFLPHKWWHYVENLETAISINVWIPAPEDDEERLKESIVQLLVKQMVTQSDDETCNHILNPNMEQLLLYNTFNKALETVLKCKNVCKEKTQSNKKFKNELRKVRDSENNENIDINKYQFIEEIPKLSEDQFNSFLEEQRCRFKTSGDNSVISKESNVIELLNVLTDPDVVSLISKKLLGSNYNK